MNDFLWELVPWGYQALLDIESWHTSVLDTFFAGVTQLGDEMFYLVLLTLLYWCFSKQVGMGVAYAFMFSTYANSWLKDLFAIPRPDDLMLNQVLDDASITQRLTPLFDETSPSWPSNHTQGAVVTWGYLALQVKKRWFLVVAVTLAALIAFSRIYGGVHFPQDVIGGALIGLVLLALWVTGEQRVRTTLAALPLGSKLGLAVGIPLAALLLHPTPGSATVMGAIAGMGVGHVLEEHTLRFSPEGEWLPRVLRGLLGLVIIIGVYLGLSALFGLVDGEIPSLSLRAIRYALVGLVGIFGAPWLFIRLGLAEVVESLND